MGLRYDPTSGKLLCDPTSGRLVGACPWIVSLPKSPYTMRNWGIDDEEPYSSYATALADIQIGQCGGSAGNPGWSLHIGYEAYILDVTGTQYACGEPYWPVKNGTTPTLAKLLFDWQHWAYGEWTEPFTLQVRVSSSEFAPSDGSGEVLLAVAQGALVGSMTVTNGGSGSKEFTLDATALAQCTSSPYFAFLADPSDAPPDPGDEYVTYSTFADLSNVKLIVAGEPK